MGGGREEFLKFQMKHCSENSILLAKVIEATGLYISYSKFHPLGL